MTTIEMTAERSQLISYLALRRVIGLLELSRPIVLARGGLVAFGHDRCTHRPDDHNRAHASSLVPPLPLVSQQIPGDDHPLNLRGPLVNFSDLGVAEEPLHGTILEVSRTAV